MAKRYRRTYGKTTVVLQGYDSGLKQMIAARMLIPGLVPIAEQIKTRAATTAVKRTGKYAAGFRVKTGVGHGTVGEGSGRPTRNPRAYARVVNNVRYAFRLEYGDSRFTAHRTLRKAAGIKKFDAPGDKYG